MTTDIDEKLTTLERIHELLNAGHTVVLRKRVSQYDVSIAIPCDKPACDRQPLETLLCEGVPHEVECVLESATGNTLADVVRDVTTLCDLPY